MSHNVLASHISKSLSRYLLKSNNIVPVHDNFLVKFPAKDDRRPITVKILDRLLSILPSICSSNFETCLFRAAFTTAFYGALRISEFVAPSKISSPI